MNRLTQFYVVFLVGGILGPAAGPVLAQTAVGTVERENAKAAGDSADDPGPHSNDPAVDTPAIAPHTIADPFGRAWMGAADGDITLVVFVDYGCPACREAQAVLEQLVAADPRLRVVFRIGDYTPENGSDAALASLAVAKRSANWLAFHRALDAGGSPTPEAIAAAARKAGIDPALTKRDEVHYPIGLVLSDPTIDEEVVRNSEKLAELAPDGVPECDPAWLIGGDGKVHTQLHFGEIRTAIAEARKAKGMASAPGAPPSGEGGRIRE